MYLEDKHSGYGLKTTKPLEPWRKLLLDAAERIELRGWCQHNECDGRGRVCILGAIYNTRPGRGGMQISSGSRHQIDPDVFRRLEKRMGGKGIATWNDDYYRTQAEVVKLLREVAMEGR